MIASMMMYDRPELSAAHDRFWALIRTELAAIGVDSPSHLSQEAGEFEAWEDPDLVLSQTCGMPYRIWLHDKVALVGTPDFGLDGCAAGYYRSPFVVRANDPRDSLIAFKDAKFAYNETFSQSGYGAPYWHAASREFWFENLSQSGGHLLSAKSVAEGSADIAALDAVTWRLIQRYDPFAADLRVLEWTKPTPGLPYITAKGRDADAMFDAINRAIAALSDADQADLGIQSLVRIPKADYLAIPNPPHTTDRPKL